MGENGSLLLTKSKYRDNNIISTDHGLLLKVHCGMKCSIVYHTVYTELYFLLLCLILYTV